MGLPRWLKHSVSREADGRYQHYLTILWWHPSFWLYLWRELEVPHWRRPYEVLRGIVLMARGSQDE